MAQLTTFHPTMRAVPTALTAFLLAAALWSAVPLSDAAGQGATVDVARTSIATYPFGDPDPIPSLYRDDRMYPYFRFDGFSHEARDQAWTVVRLENPYIDVTVLPEVGGKVWGGVEKSTGHEFIYLNDVLKFRDIAVRGPWTSGGIEHNFSVYGHTPTTATPVDYVTRSNPDGSVSVVVGATDWSSRTLWRVTMTVPADAAYLEIENLWFNPTPLDGLRYHWLNAAVQARDDLQFFFPGDHYIGHGGDAHPWPVDEAGRDLSFYRNNDFGGSKSYHVLGEHTDHFGGYWHDLDFGFGHWGRYVDTPGKKVWIWSLARSGGIWEDLLTDSDGQYVEAQAGWKFNQTLDSRGTPFGSAFFPPFVADAWTETWFPVKGTGGISDAARYGTLHVVRSGEALEVTVQALEAIEDSLFVTADGAQAHTEVLSMEPMDVVRRTVALPPGAGTVTVTVGGPELHYTSDDTANDLHRPVRTPYEADSASVAWLFGEAERYDRARQFDQALAAYEDVLERAPTHLGALTGAARLFLRRAQYDRSVEYAARALALDTYDPAANYIYGVAHARTGDLVNAKEALGWASRSLAYRSGAFTLMADISLREKAFDQAAEYAQRALDFNRFNLSAYEALAISHRLRGRSEEAREVLARLLELDPLSHFARFERYLLDPTADRLDAFASMVRGEFPDETYLELAVRYADRGRSREAVRVLEQAPDDPVVDYWRAYLTRASAPAESRAYLARALAASPEFVFPFREETLPVLRWALKSPDVDSGNAWKTHYYLGTLYWSLHRRDQAAEQFEAAGDAPAFGPFYVARAALREETGGVQTRTSVARDLQRALEEDPDQWRAWRMLIAHYASVGAPAEALQASQRAYERFPGNYQIGLEHADVLLANDRFAESADVLERARVLPHEGAQRGRRLYERVRMLLAVQAMREGDAAAAARHLEAAKQWPENLGVGKPFDPDLRLQDYALGLAYEQLGDDVRARERFREVARYTEAHAGDGGVGTYLGAAALLKLGDDAEAASLLDAWERRAGGDDLLARWAAARLGGDDTRAEELARKIEARIPRHDAFELLRAFTEAAD